MSTWNLEVSTQLQASSNTGSIHDTTQLEEELWWPQRHLTTPVT